MIPIDTLQWIVGAVALFLATQQYLALFVLLSVEEAGVPLPMPGDLLIVYLGYRVATGQANPIIVIADVVAAATIGSLALYALSRRLGRPTVLLFGKYVKLDEGRLVKVESWFKRRGVPAIVLGRLIPGLRVAASIVSGVVRLPYQTFGLSTAASAFLWAIIYLTIGILFGTAYTQFEAYLASNIELVIVIAVAIISTAMSVHLARRNVSAKKMSCTS